jgi:hypothetical protein
VYYYGVMVKHTSIIILGFFTFIIPQLGFPHVWQRNICTVLGLLTMYFGYRVLRMTTTTTSGVGDTFVEAVVPPLGQDVTAEQHD